MTIVYPRTVSYPVRTRRMTRLGRSSAWDVVHGYADPAPVVTRKGPPPPMSGAESVGRDPNWTLASILAIVAFVAACTVVVL